MKLTKEDLNTLLQIATQAAKKASQAIVDFDKSRVKTEYKQDKLSLAGQVVTQVDLLSQKSILNTLSESMLRYDIGLLTEESPDNLSREVKDYFWCIDPLDGTLAYIRGHQGYSVSIALVKKDSSPCIGVVMNPATQQLFSAVYHAEPQYYGFDNSTDSRQSSNLEVFTDYSYSKHQKKDQWDAFIVREAKKMGYNEVKFHHKGGAVMNACWVLEKKDAVYFKLPKPTLGGGSVWDFAATSALFKASGNFVSDSQGEPLNLNPKGSTYFNHCGVLFTCKKEIFDRLQNLTQV